MTPGARGSATPRAASASILATSTAAAGRYRRLVTRIQHPDCRMMMSCSCDYRVGLKFCNAIKKGHITFQDVCLYINHIGIEDI